MRYLTQFWALLLRYMAQKLRARGALMHYYCLESEAYMVANGLHLGVVQLSN